MSETYIYFVPSNQPKAGQMRIKRKVIEALTQLKIIGEIQNREYSWYSPGEDATLLFPEVEIYQEVKTLLFGRKKLKKAYLDGRMPSFDYAGFYESKNPVFLPSEHARNFLAKCPHCNSDIDEDVQCFLEDSPQVDEHGHFNPFKAMLSCSKCSRKFAFDKIRFEIATAITHFYMFFAHVSGPPINGKILDRIKEIIDCDVKLVTAML